MTQRFEGREDEYDRWFETPPGRLVLRFEKDLINELFRPVTGDLVLDAGCGTGIFTGDFLRNGARVIGLDAAASMLKRARQKLSGFPFAGVQGDMLCLPFAGETFDATVSITALEFIEDARTTITEMFRVTRPGGTIVVATLNSRSPWALRRQAKRGEHVLQGAFYRSSDDLLALAPLPGTVRSAVHFHKDDFQETALERERTGRKKSALTGGFVAARWIKP